MSAKKLLTKEIAEQYLEDENSVAVGDFTEIEDAAALVLGARKTSKWDSLDLSGLTSLGSTAAKSLSAFKGTLYLSGLTSLSDGVAESLSGHEAKLHLGGLVSLSDSTAEILAKHKGELHLSGLKMVSEKAADSLIKCKGTLHLDALKELKKFNYPVTRLLQVCLTKAGSGWGEAPPSQKHVSTAIPAEGKFAEEPGEWQNGTILIEEASTLFKWRTNYLGNPEKGNIDYKVAVRWHWSDFRGDQRKARKWFFEKLSDEHSKKTSSSRVRYVISPEAFSLWLGHEGFWIAQSFHELDQAKAEAKKRAAALAPKVSVSKQKDREPPSEKVLSAKEVGKLRKLIKTKELPKIRFVCETLDTLDATPDDWAKLFPKTRTKELVKHSCDKEKMEILDTLAGAFEPYPELFDQLQSECQNRFKYYYRGNLPLPKNHAWARIVASTELLGCLKSLGDDEISLFLAEAAAADGSRNLGNLETMSVKAAKLIVAKAESISLSASQWHLGKGFKITPEIAEILAKFTGDLYLEFSEFDDEIAGCLAKYKGDRLDLDYWFKWKDEPGHRKLARTIAKIKDGSYQSFEKANSQPLNILKEFVHENASLSFDFENKTINDEKIAFLTHESFAGSEISLQSFRVDLKTARELSKCKAAKMELQFWTNEKTGLLGGSGTGKKDPDLSKEKAVIDAILPYEGELQLGFLHYGGMGVDKAQRAFDLLIESKLEERKESLQKKIKQKSLSSASLPADVDQVEAQRKIERLKDVLRSEEAGELGLILLAAADPWMIELISAGMKVSDGDVRTNEYFETAEDESGSIGFWLAYARALEEGFHAKSLRPVKKIVLHLDSEQALRIMEEEILPRISFLEELTLTFTKEAGIFCTGSLPRMPKLKALTIGREYNYYNRAPNVENELSLTDLKRQSSLEKICLINPTSLAIEDPKPFLSKIRLQGTYERDSYGKITQINAKSLRRINSGALKVLIFNQLDHSKSKKAPAWWQDDWSSDPVVADVFGAVETADVNPYWSDKDFISLIEFKSGKKRTHKIPVGHEVMVTGGKKYSAVKDWVLPGDRMTKPLQDQTFDLSHIESFTEEMIRMVCKSAIPVRLRGNSLTEALASLLSLRKGPIELVNGSSAILRSALKGRKNATILEFSASKLGKATISAMKEFSGEELILFLSGTITQEQATALAALPFPLVLACKEHDQVEIPDETAAVLAKRDLSTKFRFDQIRDAYAWLSSPFILSKESIAALEENKNFDLGLLGTTMLVKESGKSTRFMQLSTHSLKGHKKPVLETLSGISGGSARASSKSGTVYDKKKKIVDQLMKGYRFE